MLGGVQNELLIIPDRGIKAAQHAANRMTLSTVLSLKTILQRNMQHFYPLEKMHLKV